MATLTNKRPRSDSDGDEIDTSTIFRTQENFAKFLIMESKNPEKPITSLSPFVIEKQTEALIGTPKSVKKMRNQTLLIETTRKIQTDQLLKCKTFFNLSVEVSEHKTLNSSKGIIRDKALKGESEENIKDNLQDQGVIAVKRFKIRKGHDLVSTNTLLLTFNSVVPPKSLKIFYRIIPVEIYIPNPLRCFNCQRFGHHENNCPVDLGSICERCGMGGHDHHTNHCTNPAQCVNCGKDHLSRSSDCEVWKKEKEIMKLKVTKNLTYPEARKLYDQQQPEFTFTKVVQSLSAKPETKTAYTQYNVEDSKITESSKIIVAKKQKPNSQSTSSSTTSAQPQNRTNLSSNQPSSGQPNAQRQTNRPSTNTKPTNDKHTSNRQSKGSNDAVKIHNRFGVFEEGDDMEFEETPTRPRAPNSRSISPVHPP